MITLIALGCFVAGLWIGNSFIEPRLTGKQLFFVAAVCSIVSFVPFAGGILALVVGTILIYRLSDVSFGNAAGIMFLSRGIAVLAALGFASYAEQQRDDNTSRFVPQLYEERNVQVTNNEEQVTNTTY